MKKWITTFALPFALIACSPDDNDNDGNTSSGSLVITESNKDALISETLGNFDLSSTVEDPFADFADMVETGNDPRSITPRTLSQRIEDSIDCQSGSASITTSGFDIGTGTPPANGSASFSATYNNCHSSFSGEGISYSITMNGSMTAGFSWTGYDSSDDTFDSYTITVDMDNFSMDMNINGEETSFESNFDSTMSLAGTTLTYSLNGSMSVDGAGSGSVTIQTTTPITVDTSTPPYYPSAGVITMSGGSGSSITYTVVPDGVEVSVNGGQTVLYTWEQIEAMG